MKKKRYEFKKIFTLYRKALIWGASTLCVVTTLAPSCPHAACNETDSAAPTTVPLHAVKTFCPLVPVRLTMTRLYDGCRQTATFHRNSNKLSYDMRAPGMLVLEARMTLDGAEKIYVYPKVLNAVAFYNTDIYIDRRDKEPGFTIQLKSRRGDHE